MYTEIDNEHWRENAAIIGGEFVPREYWYSPKVIKQYRGLQIVFDSYCHTVSGRRNVSFSIRVCVTCDSESSFRFSISKSNWWNKLVNLLLPHHIKNGHVDLYKRFNIHTTDKEILGIILQGHEFKKLIQSLPEVNFEISDYKSVWEGKLPEGKLELIYHKEGRTIEANELHTIQILFERILDRLLTLNIIKHVH